MGDRKKQLIIVRGGGDIATGTFISCAGADTRYWC